MIPFPGMPENRTDISRTYAEPRAAGPSRQHDYLAAGEFVSIVPGMYNFLPKQRSSCMAANRRSAVESTMSTSMPLSISRDVSLFEKNNDCPLAEDQVLSCSGMRQMSCMRDVSSTSVENLMRVCASCECQVAAFVRKAGVIAEWRSHKNFRGELEMRSGRRSGTPHV